MANPLKELELTTTAFQRIQEVPINATPAKVWASLVNVSTWFGFGPDRSQWAKPTLELFPGGRWFTEGKDGSSMFLGNVTLVEPNKLLRLAGPLGLTHLPVLNVFIFELQPKDDGKTTLLRLGQRTFGYTDADLEKRTGNGWAGLLAQLKDAAEKA